MFGGFHKYEEPRKVDDARHVGVGEFYSAFGAVFVWHSKVNRLAVCYPINVLQKMADYHTI